MLPSASSLAAQKLTNPGQEYRVYRAPRPMATSRRCSSSLTTRLAAPTRSSRRPTISHPLAARAGVLVVAERCKTRRVKVRALVSICARRRRRWPTSTRDGQHAGPPPDRPRPTTCTTSGFSIASSVRQSP
ncbi:hypothetical protein VTK73DRAFT_9163 [Phialemonium thermophilum]|uniref:Uncharacterized protein n=1 Tax=Phialemonium thermophilum TaxID=223376 RepID=A0ABR3W498_9PEZI